MTDEVCDGIAIIGMSGRFPGARNVDEFWRNLRDGVESIRQFSAAELAERGVPAAALERPNFVGAGTILDDAEMFDAGFFGYNPREAELIDPQQRVFLEAAWEALETAGYNPETYPGAVGVYAGVGMNSYVYNLLSNPEVVAAAGGYQFMIANDKDFLATRVSYKLNLRGPSLSVQTACSTSLVAVQLACQGLYTYQCDMALAGGVCVMVPQGRGYFYQEGMILSPDGHCRAFDEKARGTVSGQGVGIVVLKRLAEALQDGDTILAVIKGAAVNNDGSMKVGYTAPSVDGQAEVIAGAMAFGQIQPETVTYVEAHGTGTPLGDPIEIAALTHAFQGAAGRRGFCAIGSVKSNIGHLDAAAGVTGLIKTVLALRHRQIPPSLHFQKPNPKIDFENSPFFVNTQLREWAVDGMPRRAGVSSFGIGGTNAHVVVEEAPAGRESDRGRELQLLVFSGATDKAVARSLALFEERLRLGPELNLADAAYTLQVGRKAWSRRRALVCADRDEAMRQLADPDSLGAATEGGSKRPVVFLFPGQGAQHVGMGRGLYESEPLFRRCVDESCETLRPHLGLDLRRVLYPEDGGAGGGDSALNQTSLTQPALFVIEHALARLWMSWGVQPEAMIGHSIGEYVAACLAGVFALDDALALVAARGRLMQELPAGSMLAVGCAPETAAALLERGGWARELAIATMNAPNSCVVSGPSPLIRELERVCQAEQIGARLLHTSHAFHSPMMDPILDPFLQRVRQVKLKAPARPYISNRSGTWIKGAEAANPAYWVDHLRHAVRFSDGVAELLKDERRMFLEVGPGHTLITLARQQRRRPEQVFLASLRHPRETLPDLRALLSTLGRLWVSGCDVDWKGFHGPSARRRIPLPTYPFERQRYWIEPAASPKGAVTRAAKRRLGLEDWLAVPSWKRGRSAAYDAGGPSLGSKRTWLILLDEHPLAAELVARLRDAGEQLIVVRAGAERRTQSGTEFHARPGEREDLDAVVASLAQEGRIPDIIVHLWALESESSHGTAWERFERASARGCHSLIQLAQALARHRVTAPVDVTVVAGRLHEVTGGEPIDPAQWTVLGPCRVIPQEHPNFRFRCIDIGDPDQGRPAIEWLLAELRRGPGEPLVALRGPHRWIQFYEPLPVEAGRRAPRLRNGGVYLITGGLGQMGLLFAEFLAREWKAKIALIGRTGLPEGDAKKRWLEEHGPEDAMSRRIQRVEALSQLGGEVMVIQADASRAQEIEAAVARIEARFGAIHGVIHAAGEPEAATIQELDAERARKQFRPKVAGLLHLQSALAERSLDFVLLASSLSSVLGGLGFAAYAAGNLYLDGAAQAANRGGTTPWYSVNWDGWRFAAAAGGAAEAAIGPEEGVEMLRRILSLEAGMQVLVSVTDLQARIQDWVRLEAVRQESEPAAPKKVRLHARPNLSSAYVAPGSQAEETIAEIWQELLGIEKVGVDDNFFELGGHSLLATQVIARLRGAFPIEFSVADIFERPTVRALARKVAAPAQAAAGLAAGSERGRKRKERKLQRMSAENQESVS